MVDVEFYKGAFGLPAMVSGRARIYMEAVETVVVHYFEYMAVSADKQARAGIAKHLCNPRLIMTRIAPDVGHENGKPLHRKLLNQGEIPSALSMVDITVDGTHHRAHPFEAAYHIYAANVARMPDFITIGKMQGKTGIPTPVRIRQYPYSFHRNVIGQNLRQSLSIPILVKRCVG